MPSVWNLGDDSPASMVGGVGWYRKDFTVPQASKALEWAVRFESVNYRSRVWLNGKRVGSNAGAYLPFQLRLRDIKRRGTNRLVVRVDSRHRGTDFPPAGRTADGLPTGGWWNYSGMQREVYLERLNRVDWKAVRVVPRLRPRSVQVRATVRNVNGSSERVRITGRFGSQRLNLGSGSLSGGGTRSFTTTIRVPNAKLWTPSRPYLYPVKLTASVGGRAVSSYQLRTGMRTVRVAGDGRLLLNGKRLRLRGVGVHEESKAQGFAVDNAFRSRLVSEVKAVGRDADAHALSAAPRHAGAGRQGGRPHLVGGPGLHAQHAELAKRGVIDARPRSSRRTSSPTRPPVGAAWSIANELRRAAGSAQTAYIKNAVRLAKSLDPSRPVGLASPATRRSPASRPTGRST